MPQLIPLVVSGLSAIGGGSAIAGATTLASTAAGLFGASNQAGAVNSASNAQQASAQAAIDEQRREFGINQTNLQPWLTAGQSALSQQMQLLGLGGLTSGAAGGGGASTASAQPNFSAYVQNNPDLLAAYQSQQGLARGKSMDQFGAEHWSGYGQGENRSYTPFSADGTGAPTTADASTTPALSAGDQQQAAIDQLKNSPLYQSLYGNGVNTILGNSSATGGLRGGNTQTSLARFGSDTLSTVIENQLQHLGGLSGQGQSAAGTLGTLGAGTSGNISNLLTQQGSAQAGGILGSASAGQTGLAALLAGLGKAAGGASSVFGGSNTPVLV